MTLKDIAAKLDATPIVKHDSFDETLITAVVASDLMSDVLVAHHDDFLLITSLASDQAIRTADLVGAIGVVLVNNKQPPASVIALAESLEINLLSCRLPKYETCLAIGQIQKQTAS